ncbi:MAG: beta-galactosidase trimerization domain-containing protein [Spirochaetales bacterium]|nr:beta-galactosidase trimerization domain-containing protein [Spirochaetales bacterium]
MKLWAWQSVLLGGDKICFFRWRTPRYGTEQFWHGLIPHHGNPANRYKELLHFSSELSKVQNILENAEINSRIAIIYDIDSLWALEHQPQSLQGFSYIGIAKLFTEAFRLLGHTLDIVSSSGNFEKYELIVFPSQFVADEDISRRLRTYIENGGKVILGPRSGVKERDNSVVNQSLPGVFQDLAGICINDYDPVGSRQNSKVSVSGCNLDKVKVAGIADIIDPEIGTDILLTYQGIWYSGKAAATIKKKNDGCCLYLGTLFEAKEMSIFLINSGLINRRIKEMPENVEIFELQCPNEDVVAILNYSSTEKIVELEKRSFDIFNASIIEDEIKIPAYDIKLIKSIQEQ